MEEVTIVGRKFLLYSDVVDRVRALEGQWTERARTREFEPESEILHCIDDLCTRFGVERIFPEEQKAEAT